MPAEITLFTGPARTGKTARLVELVSTELSRARPEGKLGTVLWIAPHFRATDGIRQRLLNHRSPHAHSSPHAPRVDSQFSERDDYYGTPHRSPHAPHVDRHLSERDDYYGRAILGLSIRTFDQFAEALLGGAIEGRRPLSQLQKRRLIAELLAELNAAGKLAFFQELAERPSLIETIGRSIGELQRRGITPKMLVQRAKRATATIRDRDMALLYSEYQRRLDAHQLYDNESRLTLASEQVRRGELGAFADLRLVVVDGLTTFSFAQQAMLVALAERVERIAISLDLEEMTERPELFAMTRETVAELREVFSGVKVEALAPRNAHAHADEGMTHDSGVLRYLERNLFINPRKLKSQPSSAEGIEIIAAANQQDEVLQVARKVKHLLVKGVPAREILLTARSLTGLDERIREVFTRFGIPFATEGRRKLGDEPLVKLLIAFLELDANDWPYRPLVRLLTNRRIAAFDRHRARGAAEWIVRDLQFAKGREALLKAVGRLAKRSLPHSSPHAPHMDSHLSERDDDNEPPDSSPHAPRVDGHLSERDDYYGPQLPRDIKAGRALPILKELAAALEEAFHRRPQAPRVDNPLAEQDDNKETPDNSPHAPHVDSHLSERDDYYRPLDWYTALERLAQRLGIAAENTESLTSLRQALRAAEQLASWQGGPPPQLDRSQLLALLRDIASHESLPEPNDDTGCVRVMSAPTARLLSPKHLFVMGLVEQAFPLPEPVGELYSDRELDTLSGVKRPGDRPERSSAEMLLFYELVTRATKCVTFSYAALDAKALEQFASPYLQDVKRLFQADAIPETKPQENLIPIPKGPPASDADWRVQAVAHALHKSPHLLAGLLQEGRTIPTARALAAGLAATHHRTRGESFGPFEGVFATGPAGRLLAERFGSQHLWSPSQLEEYATCPFRFLMKQVCRFEPPGEMLLDTDPRRKGTLAHEALARLHRKLQARVEEPQTVSHLGAETLQMEFQSALAEARAQWPTEGVAGALAELEMAEISRWSEAYSAQHHAYDQQWSKWDVPLKPSHFEVRFGPNRGGAAEEGEDARSTDEPFTLVVGGEELRFAGRIDRIDVGRFDGQTVLTIVDYKSGSSVRYKTEDVEAGKQLQLVLYALAAEQHLFRKENATTIKAGYWALSEDKLEGRDKKRWVDFHRATDGELAPNETWATTWQQTTDRIAQLVKGIRHGDFPMYNTNEKCTSSCDFRTVCRVGIARNVEKEWKPEPIASSELE